MTATHPALVKSEQKRDEEDCTFEMGYITFFPKNNNENFQTIPDQSHPEPPKPND